MRKMRILAGLALVGAAIAACDGPQENAGEKADVMANASVGRLQDGPQEQVGELRDRVQRDQGRAAEAHADAAEDRADELRTTADQQADALEQQAAKLRDNAKEQAKALDQQADAIRGR
jgi:hypothetical protein